MPDCVTGAAVSSRPSPRSRRSCRRGAENPLIPSVQISRTTSLGRGPGRRDRHRGRLASRWPRRSVRSKQPMAGSIAWRRRPSLTSCPSAMAAAATAHRATFPAGKVHQRRGAPPGQGGAMTFPAGKVRQRRGAPPGQGGATTFPAGKVRQRRGAPPGRGGATTFPAGKVVGSLIERFVKCRHGPLQPLLTKRGEISPAAQLQPPVRRDAFRLAIRAGDAKSGLGAARGL